MFGTKDYIRRDLEQQKDLQKKFRQVMKYMPAGRLTTTTVGGKTYYYKVVDGKRQYLGTASNPEVQRLQRKHFAMESLKRIEKNRPLLENFLNRYADLSIEEILASSPQAYQPPLGIEVNFAGNTAARNWGSQHYRKSTAYPEGLVHRTLKGEFVRSKSEVIIANSLFIRDVEYRYEGLIELGDHVIAPDFQILVKSENKVKILEHFGMLGDADYMDRTMWKIRTYLEHGYRPWKDILFTFEDQYGNIDAGVIDKLISAFCV